MVGLGMIIDQRWHNRHPGWIPRGPGTPGDPRVIATHPPPAKAAPRADPRVISRYPSCRVYTGCCEPGLSVHSSTTCSNTRCLHKHTSSIMSTYDNRELQGDEDLRCIGCCTGCTLPGHGYREIQARLDGLHGAICDERDRQMRIWQIPCFAH